MSPNRRGIFVVIGLIVLGLVVMSGLFIAARGRAPAKPNEGITRPSTR
jgi:hypothetical protein